MYDFLSGVILVHGTEGGVLTVTSNSSTDMMSLCVESVIQMMGWKNVIFIIDKSSLPHWGKIHKLYKTFKKHLMKHFVDAIL